MTNLENRVIRLERLCQSLDDKLRRLTDLVTTLAQNARVTGGGGSTPGGGSGTTVYEVPAGVVISAGSSNTADVYIMTGGSSVKVTTAATIYNTYAVATTTGKALTVGSNGDGTYTVIGQSC